MVSIKLPEVPLARSGRNASALKLKTAINVYNTESSRKEKSHRHPLPDSTSSPNIYSAAYLETEPAKQQSLG